MSALMILKNICVSSLSNQSPSYRRAIINTFNAIENDLVIHGYEPSSDVDEALAELDKALIAEGNLEDEKLAETKEDSPLRIKSLKSPIIDTEGQDAR